MKILVATDKFKDALSAEEAAAAMAEGIRAALPATKVLQLPLSDGGDGFASLAAGYAGAKIIKVEVNGPLQQAQIASYAWLPRHKQAYIEMAEAAGLQLIPHHLRSPLNTTTFGVGQLIKHAIEIGAQEIYLGIGGSATHDIGVGMAAALGYHFLDAGGRPFLPTGGSLHQVDRIGKSHLYENLHKVKIKVACDVTNPLTGTRGAAHTYAAQKGASSKQIEILEAGTIHLARLIARDLGKPVEEVAGGGAAGGLGAGALAFLNASLAPGAGMVLELAGFAPKAAEADLVFTGEGKADRESLQGKLIGEVARQTAKAGKPLILLCGKLELPTHLLYKAGIWHAAGISPADEPLETSLQRCRQRLVAATKQSLQLYLKDKKKPL
ncbi:glycerate kinase [Cesiribacter sp. SM1]|uniref:glycerate kinase n=1 Tax=Cesiribacter sp. SM1 TaxID=2861196 RepID=UPI001CD393A1|nr:glycerate kinase [Cesiribacter sp. SM1]